jgi:predicted RNA-binding protein YlqC (UPF0109 family)
MFDDEGVPSSGSEAHPSDDPVETEGYPRSSHGLPEAIGESVGGSEAETHLREVVRYLASQLVDEPDAVVVSSRRRHQTVTLSLRVADGELGKIIGRQGRTARAIRTAVQIAGARHDVRVSLDIEG